MSDLRRMKLVIISTAFVLMSSVPISTVYSDIMLKFSDSPGWLLDFMTVALGPMSVAAMAISGLLHRVMGTKGLTVCALLLILVTGILPIFGGGIVTVIFARCSVGFACGLLSPAVTTLSAQHFKGAEKEKIMGYRNASQAFGSMSMMAITMLLAGAGWRWAFSIYLLVLPSLFIALFVMPDGAAADEGHSAEESEVEEGLLPSLPVLRVAFYAGISFLYLACLNTLAPSLSSFLVQEGIAAGTLSGVGMIAYMVGSFLSPFLADWGAGLLLGTVNMRNRYLVAAVTLLIFSIVTLLYRLYRSRMERKISISQ